MKFFKGQKVICISKKADWDYVVPNLNEYLKLALNVNRLPEEGKEYVVTNQMSLHYKKMCYIEIEGFDSNIFAESGFEPLDELEMANYESEASRTAYKIKNN